jgi:hypothetical protein
MRIPIEQRHVELDGSPEPGIEAGPDAVVVAEEHLDLEPGLGRQAPEQRCLVLDRVARQDSEAGLHH